MVNALIPGAELQTTDSMIFPFEINEIEDEKIEFNGEQNPDRNYFNQFPHQLSKSSNYLSKILLTNEFASYCYNEQKYWDIRL